MSDLWDTSEEVPVIVRIGLDFPAPCAMITPSHLIHSKNNPSSGPNLSEASQPRCSHHYITGEMAVS